MKHIITKLKHSIGRHKLSTPWAIVIGSIIISCGLVGYGLVTGGTSSAPAQMFAGSEINENDYVFGKKDSDVIVIEYSDTECPYCISLHPTIEQIQSVYKDKIAYVYRHFPLTQIHPGAFDEARAISCAGNVGGDQAYYNFMEALFDYKYDNKTTTLPANNDVYAVAKKVGLNASAFSSCMSSQQTARIVSAHQQDGIAAGVQGTPATFVLSKTRKGYEIVAGIDGAQPQPIFMAAIEEALSR